MDAPRRHRPRRWDRLAVLLSAGLVAMATALVGGTPVRAGDPFVPVVTLTADRAYVYPGDPVTLTAAISPNPGGGTVTFSGAGGAADVIGTVPVAPEDGTAVIEATAVRGLGSDGFLVGAEFSGFGDAYGAAGIVVVEMRYLPNIVFPEPPGPTNRRSATVPFVVGEGVTTECRLDGSPWESCTSPWTASGLAEGSHTLEVRGTVPDGRVGNPYPATWLVDLTPPVPVELSLGGGVATTNQAQLDLVARASDELSGVLLLRLSASGRLDADGNLDAVPARYDPDRPRQWGMDPTKPSGPQTTYAQWFDAAGNASPIATATVDVRNAWPRLADGAWTTISPVVDLAIDGVDPDEVRGIRIANLGPSWNPAAPPVELGSAPATWDVTEPGHSYLSGPGFRAVEITWLDAAGHWSAPRVAAINLVVAPRPDVILDEGASVTRDPIVQADLSIGSVGYQGRDLALQVSCNGVTWGGGMAQVGLVTIYIGPEGFIGETGCPPDGPRTVQVRWRWYETAWSEPRSATIDYQPDASLPSDDATPPDGSVAIAGAASAVDSNAVTLAVPASDAASGVTNVRLSNDGVAWTTRAYAPSQAWTLAPGSGRRTVWVRWRDGAANWSTPRSASVVVDTTRPAVSTPGIRLAEGRRASTVSGLPVAVTWSGIDAGSGVARYQLAVRVDGGAFRRIASDLRAPTSGRTLAPGHIYRFRVRAIDRAGNVSPWVVSRTTTVAALFDRSPALRYEGAWRTVVGGALVGGTERVSREPGAGASVAVRARGVAWVATVGPGRGRARVFVDGVLAATVDLHSPGTVTRRVVWAARWPSIGDHRITIRLTGNPGGRVGVDAIGILR